MNSNAVNHLRTDMNARFGALVIVFALTVAAPELAQAQTLKVLHSFGGSDGSQPYAGVTIDTGGNLYGTTEYGGMLNCDGGGPAGCGVAYKLKKVNAGWLFSVLYEFPGNDGDFTPTEPGNITLGPNGSPYGTQAFGGAGVSGILFHLQPPARATVAANTPWSYYIDHQFGSSGNDGDQPTQIIFDRAGNILGAAEDGGTGNAGVVYELTPSDGGWIETILYSFLGMSDGTNPSGVALDDSGNIFGVTRSGGNQGCYQHYGCGTVYELTRSGSNWIKTTLYVFENAADGSIPGPLMRDGAGNLFGLTAEGAAGNGGTIWELSPSNGGWVFNVLYTFPAPTRAWAGPFPPVMDANGVLWGVNNWGGAHNYGSVYKLAPSNGTWIYTDLYDFVGGGDGCYPRGPVALDAVGNIYGTTQQCARGGGTVWELTP